MKKIALSTMIVFLSACNSFQVIDFDDLSESHLKTSNNLFEKNVIKGINRGKSVERTYATPVSFSAASDNVILAKTILDIDPADRQNPVRWRPIVFAGKYHISMRGKPTLIEMLIVKESMPLRDIMLGCSKSDSWSCEYEDSFYDSVEEAVAMPDKKIIQPPVYDVEDEEPIVVADNDKVGQVELTDTDLDVEADAENTTEKENQENSDEGEDQDQDVDQKETQITEISRTIFSNIVSKYAVKKPEPLESADSEDKTLKIDVEKSTDDLGSAKDDGVVENGFNTVDKMLPLINSYEIKIPITHPLKVSNKYVVQLMAARKMGSVSYFQILHPTIDIEIVSVNRKGRPMHFVMVPGSFSSYRQAKAQSDEIQEQFNISPFIRRSELAS